MRDGSWPVPRGARAPLTVPWSVMHSTSTPLARTASSSSSGVVVASPDHIVWRWKSTRTWPGRRGAARWGWTSAAVSAPTEADVADHEGDAGGPARQPFEVGADGGHVLEHALEGRRHRGLAHGLGQGAVVHHQALDADREVAADGVGARVEADHRAHEQALANVGQKLALVALAGGEAEGAAADAGRALEPAPNRRPRRRR